MEEAVAERRKELRNTQKGGSGVLRMLKKIRLTLNAKLVIVLLSFIFIQVRQSGTTNLLEYYS